MRQGLIGLAATLLLPGCIPQVEQPYRTAPASYTAPPASSRFYPFAVEAPPVPPEQAPSQHNERPPRAVPPPPPPTGIARPVWEARPVAAEAIIVAETSYQVQPGDTLARIAARTGSGTGAIARANELAPPFRVTPGQRLAIPGGRYHIVRPGQTGIAIARAYGVEWSRIVEANALAEPFVLSAGERILIPAPPTDAGRTAERAAAFRLDIDDIITGGEPAPAPRQPPLGAGSAVDAMPVALWPVGRTAPGDAVMADWAAQGPGAFLVVPSADRAPDGWRTPDRLITDADAVAAAARRGAWLVFAGTAARLDPAVAATLSGLFGLADVVALGVPAALPDEAARLATWLRPDRPGPLAVRADVVADYPGPLVAELAAGRLAPLRWWLAGRGDLRWAALPCPDPGACPDVPGPDAPGDTDPDWRRTDGGPVPARVPARLSLALWQGWDAPGLPAAAALLAAAGDGPVDLLVPSGGDDARGRDRLAAAQALIAARSAARARLVDTPGDAAEAIPSLLRATDGEVAILSDGAACPGAATLARMAAWALHPQVGPVGLVGAGWTGAALLADGVVVPADGPGPVSLVSWGLMAVAAQRLAAVAPPTIDPMGPAGAAALWSLQLQAHGWQPVALAGAAAGGMPAGFAPGPLPWALRAAIRVARVMP